MKHGIIVLILLSLTACTHPSSKEFAVVKVVQCEVRKGSSDCMTVVEFPDRERRERYGKWGEVGDTLLASKSRKNHYNW